MGHTHLDDNSGNSYKKLTVKGGNKKAFPTDIISECNVDDHYFKCLCENASSEVMHSKTDDEYFLEVRRTSVYHSSSSHRKLWLGASKGPKGERRLDSRSNSMSEKDLDVQNCSQRHTMSRLCELQKGEIDDLVTEESSTMYLNSMVKDKKPETENLIHNMSNLPHYLQQAEKGESFQERALRFGVLDWSLLEKWNRNRGRGQRGFCSPSGSDTSSSFSTLGSSSFSCRSDHSSSAKREMSPSSSLHAYLNSSSVSSTNLHGLSYSSSPTNGQERYPSCVEGLRHGSKQSFPNVQIKTDCEGKHYEHLDLKFLQRKVVDSQGSKVEVPNDIHSSLEKKISYSVHKAPNHKYFPRSGMGNDSGTPGSKTEQSSNFVFELPKEQWVSGPATPGFFSARDRSPETCSEVSLNLEDASLKLGENSKVLGKTGSASPDDDINIHFVDCLEELPAAHADEGNIQTGDPSIRDKCVAYSHDLPPQKVDPNVSISTECDRSSIYLDDYGSIFQDPQESILAKSFVCPVDRKLRDVSRNSIQLRTEANDDSFHQSQSAIRSELQPRDKDADVPVKMAAAFSDQHLPETVVTNKFPVATSRNYRSRRAKSLSLNGNTDCAIDDHLTFMTPKSFSVRSDTCSSDCTLSKDGCKRCKKSAVSPLRRWIDPIVKSRERHRIDVSSSTPLQRNSFNHGHDADVLNSKEGIGENKSLRKSLAQGFSRASHITLRNSSVRSTSSDCQAFRASENDTSGKHSLHMSRSRCSSPRPKHEKIPERKSQSAVETGITSSSMPAPPAHPPILQGLLHLKYKNGFPYFTFSRNESDEVLAAKTWKDNSERRDFDWMYSFHSGKSTDKKRNKSGWGSWGRKDNHIPDLVANMKVSSSLRSKLNGHGNIEHLVETEFVLFGAKKGNINSDPIVQTEYAENNSFSQSKVGRSEISLDMPLSNSSPLSTTSSTSMPKDTMESIIPRNVLPPKHSDRKSELHVPGYPSRQNFGEPCQSNSMRSRSEGRNMVQATQREPNVLNSNVSLSSPFSPDLELAALVIKIPLEWRESVKGGQGEDAASNEFGGWGLKFLAKNLDGSSSETYFDYPIKLPPEFDDDSHCHSLKSSVSPIGFGNISMDNSCRNSERCSFENGSSESSDIHSSCGVQGHTGVTVIIPAGIHSQPSTNSGGPSPLIERWRSGGSCDCGGWDLNCPLTILENQNPKKNNLSERIFRADQGTLALSLDVVHDGLYLLRFHPQLSALQAFSIGVAMLHSREPLMFSKEAQIEKPCSRSSLPPRAKQGRTLSQAISTPQDDIPISMPSNHDVFFASRVSDPPLSPFGRV